jgi:hypothetical protein
MSGDGGWISSCWDAFLSSVEFDANTVIPSFSIVDTPTFAGDAGQSFSTSVDDFIASTVSPFGKFSIDEFIPVAEDDFSVALIDGKNKA